MRDRFISSIMMFFWVLALCFMSLPLASGQSANIDSARSEIESLIEAGKLTDAQAQIEQLKSDYYEDPQLPDALYWIAQKYRWKHKWEKSKALYQQIMQDYPGSLYASKAELGSARVDILPLIIAKNFGPAGKAVDEMVTDFTGHPDLPGSLYWIAREYEWSGKCKEAKDTFERILQQNPESKLAGKARLGVARMEVIILIIEGPNDTAKAALDKLETDFAEHPDLPDTLYEIAKAYDYKRSLERGQGFTCLVGC